MEGFLWHQERAWKRKAGLALQWWAQPGELGCPGSSKLAFFSVAGWHMSNSAHPAFLEGVPLQPLPVPSLSTEEAYVYHFPKIIVGQKQDHLEFGLFPQTPISHLLLHKNCCHALRCMLLFVCVPEMLYFCAVHTDFNLHK